MFIVELREISNKTSHDWILFNLEIEINQKRHVDKFIITKIVIQLFN